MSNAFKRSISFTDIHFGNKGNSAVFNQDCTDFVDWMCSVAKKRDCETCIFLGDWHHHRNTINVSTLNYTAKNLKKLNDSFEKVFFIPGNHDLLFRENRSVNSLPMLDDQYPNIKVIHDLTTIGDVVFCPWLVGDEWKKIKKLQCKYMFGHFEIPGFKLNAQIEMPDHGEINRAHFNNIEYVFSGHFHRRQISGNIHYIGNAFGHDYSTSWDFDHGCMILEYGKEPEYINWENCPKYITIKLSDLLANTGVLCDRTYVKCEQDIELTYEESSLIKEEMISSYNVREFKMFHNRGDDGTTPDDTVTFGTVDEIITAELNQIDSETFDKNTLLAIYRDL